VTERTDQVADVFDQQDVGAAEVEGLHPVADHVGVKVAAGAGVDLSHRHAGGGDAVCIVAGLLVPLKDGEMQLVIQVGQGSLEDRGFPRTGRADQIKDEHPIGDKRVAIAPGQPAVFGKDIFLDAERPGLVIMLMPVFVLVPVHPVVVVPMFMISGAAAAIDAHAQSTSNSMTLSSLPCSRSTLKLSHAGQAKE